MRVQKLFLITMLLSFMLSTTPAQAGIIEFFFPSLAKRDPNLYDTLRAPFADAPPPEEKLDISKALEARLPENSVPPEKPHRQVRQISEYVSDIVSQSMMFQGESYKEDLKNILMSFDDDGATQYKAFLQEKNILNVLQSERYHMRSFVIDTPLMLNSGPVDGRYRWLFEVPVMISYMERSATDYSNGEAPTNQKVILRLQVGRHPEVDNKTGILVETWSGAVKKLDKK